MVPVFIIALREFLEAFLSIGVLLSISSKFHLQQTKGIIGGSVTGFIFIFLFATVLFGMDSTLVKILPTGLVVLIEGWMFVASSIFIAYAVFSLHRILSHYSTENMKQAETKLDRYKVSYWLLPFTAFLFVVKEGSEGVFFNLSNGIFYTFSQDLIGFVLAFLVALLFGIILQKFIGVLSIKRIFRVSEVFIIFVGVDALTEGLGKLAIYYFHIDMSPYDMLIALIYIVIIYEFFIRDEKKIVSPLRAINMKRIKDLRMRKKGK